MKRRIGILTSGGDCPGLNACIRGVARASYSMFDAEIIGIQDGYAGLIAGDYKEMKQSDFSGILTLGGTILGTRRTPFRNMRVIGEDNVDKVKAMKSNYKKMKLDCLVTLGGNGTHKTANLLAEEGLNVIGLPKTIDNDIWGTDVTFGFHTAVDIATEVIDRIHTTAASHGRCMVIEIMGNKAGWLTLYSGIAGGADIILLPEIPYDINIVAEAVRRRAENGKDFSIIAVAEGATRSARKRASTASPTASPESWRRWSALKRAPSFRVMCSAAARPAHTTACSLPSLAYMPRSSSRLRTMVRRSPWRAMWLRTIRFPTWRARPNLFPPTRRLSVPPEAWAFPSAIDFLQMN